MTARNTAHNSRDTWWFNLPPCPPENHRFSRMLSLTMFRVGK